MTNVTIRSILLVMLVSFSVSFAILWRQNKPRDLVVVQTKAERGAPPDTVPATLPVLPAAPGTGVLMKPTDAPPLAMAVRGEASSNPPEPVEQNAAQAAAPLPIAFHIWNRRNLNRIEGDVMNTSGAPILLTLRAVNPTGQQISELQMQLAPAEKRKFSTDDGLQMQSNDQLILQSPPFLDSVRRVP